MSKHPKETLIVFFVCLIVSLNTMGQISINVNYEIDKHDKDVNDFFGGRKVKYENRYSVMLIKKVGKRVNAGINYSFNSARITPHLTNLITPANNFKNYHRVGGYIDFDFTFNDFIRPFIFNNTGYIFDYPKSLGSYERSNSASINSQLGLGIKLSLYEGWSLNLQYSIGQILGLNSFKIFEDTYLFGIGLSYKITDCSRNLKSSD